jgi:hypothetical protein
MAANNDGRSFFLFFFIEIENFRGEGKFLTRHTHDTTFSLLTIYIPMYSMSLFNTCVYYPRPKKHFFIVMR